MKYFFIYNFKINLCITLEYKLGKHFSEEAFKGEFGPEATYPQVTIGLNHIGNMNEALKYMSSRGMFL